MYPWEYQKELRRSAKWIRLRRKLLDEKHRKDFRWIPWVISHRNSDDAVKEIDKPMLPLKDAKKVFGDLVELGLLEEERFVGENDDLLNGWLYIDSGKWKAFGDDNNIWSIYIAPLPEWILKNKWVGLGAALLAFLVSPAIIKFSESYGEKLFRDWVLEDSPSTLGDNENKEKTQD